MLKNEKQSFFRRLPLQDRIFCPHSDRTLIWVRKKVPVFDDPFSKYCNSATKTNMVNE